MNGRNAKALRRSANRAVRPSFEAAAAALSNEQITRRRVEDLEIKVSELRHWQQKGLFGRLRWLVFGA